MTKEYYIPGATYPHENEPEILYENGFPIVPQPPAVSSTASKGFARRDFLKGAGVLVVGFSMAGAATKLARGSSAEAAGEACAAADASGAAVTLVDPPIDQVDSYLVISQDGSVTASTSLVDLGQGITQQYIQWVAEELDVSMARINVVLGDTGLVANDGGMFGSRATNLSGAKFRRAAAAARVKLLELAAARFGVTVDKLTVKDGVITVTGDPTKSVTYAQLIAGKRFEVKIEDNQKTKPFTEYKIIGQPIPRADIPAKLTGQEEYVHDVRLPGMLHARAIRPKGQSLSVLNSAGVNIGPHSVLESVDMQSVAGVKGLVKVVPISDMATRLNGNNPFGGRYNFVGVVCEREEQAIEAARKLKVTWGTPPAIPADLYQHLYTVGRNAPTVRQGGDVAAAFASADKVISATYKFPFQMHASMGSACGVADVKVDATGKVVSATVWSSSQATFTDRTAVGNALGIPAAEIPDRVRVIWRYGPGAYGGGGTPHQVPPVDAALLSRAVGKPVRVQWFREDTHGWESYGPLHLFNIRAGLSNAGKVTAYEYDSWGSTANATSSGERYTFARTPANFRVLGGGPVGGTFFLTATLRAPEQPANTFASESFIDELAAAAKADPLAFRQAHLDPSVAADARALDVLNKAAEKFGWVKRTSPNPANAGNRTGVVRGRGIAYGPRSGAYVAHICEVEVNQSTGVVRAIRYVVAHDIGLIVNPESLNQQIEGNVNQTLSRAIWEEVTHDGRRVSSLDWVAYPFLKLSEVPKIETVLINRPELGTGTGGGEATAVGVVAALGNAIFDATGARLRQVPFTPVRVKAALAARS